EKEEEEGTKGEGGRRGREWRGGLVGEETGGPERVGEVKKQEMEMGGKGIGERRGGRGAGGGGA
ncbi:hypothetical protein VW29_10205, partial [Devosia limi DSM 17137]